MSDGQTSGQAPVALGNPVGQPLLSLALTSMMDAVGAHSGAVYPRLGDEPVLEMAGLPGRSPRPGGGWGSARRSRSPRRCGSGGSTLGVVLGATATVVALAGDSDWPAARTAPLPHHQLAIYANC